MSLKGSNKEFILSLYLKKYKHILEGILGYELENIELERPNFGHKKIDFYAVNPNKRLEVFMEVQRTPSDSIHLGSVNNFILGLQEGTVIWLAQRFNKEHILKVKSLLNENKHKYIDFIAMEIDQKVLGHLDHLNSIYTLDVWSNLELINQSEYPIKVVDVHKQIPPTHIGRKMVERNYDFTRIDDVKDYVLEKLRISIPHYLNLHKSKKHLEGNLSISIGGGKDSLNYRLSVKDRRNMAYVELHFGKNQLEFYERFLTHYDVLRKYVHPDIVMKKGRIGVYFKPFANLDETITSIAQIFDRFISYFSPYTYNFEEVIPNFEEKKEGDVAGVEEKIVEDLLNIDREWLQFAGFDANLADILSEEVDNERAYIVKKERLSEYLISK